LRPRLRPQLGVAPRRDAVDVEVALAEPTWRDEHLMRLLRERLAKLELVAPVIGIRLEAQQLQAMAPPTLHS